MITKQFIINGKVQGVAYRYFVKDSADKLGVIGTVKNLIDGTVKVIAQSDEGPLALFEAYLYKGSPHSLVEHIDIIIIDNFPYLGFKIIG